MLVFMKLKFTLAKNAICKGEIVLAILEEGLVKKSEEAFLWSNVYLSEGSMKPGLFQQSH